MDDIIREKIFENKFYVYELIDPTTDKVVESILEGIDDDDVEMACARQLLHRKILTKYDVEMKKKMLEKLVSYKDFGKI